MSKRSFAQNANRLRRGRRKNHTPDSRATNAASQKAEKGTEIPDTIQIYRDGVRTACIAREIEVNGCNNVSTLEAYVTKPQAEGGFTPWPTDPNGEL